MWHGGDHVKTFDKVCNVFGSRTFTKCKNTQSILKIKMFAPMSIPLFEISCVIFSH
jgi:hypothetical protein